MTEQSAHKKYEFKKKLEGLKSKKGHGTELISLYIPSDKQISVNGSWFIVGAMNYQP